jgi:hypothetical protein
VQIIAGRPDARSGGRAVDNYPVIGQVVGIHIDEKYLKNGLPDLAAVKPIARCGYHDFAVVDSVFRMTRPGLTAPIRVRNF